MTQQEFNRRLTLTLMQATLAFQACAFNQPITFEKALKAFNRSLVELQEALQQMEIPDTDAIIPTMVMAVGRLVGINENEMVALLKAKGATGIEHARAATSALVPVGAGSAVATGDSIPTGSDEGRPRV